MKNSPEPDYQLDRQVGFVMRKAWQRHTAIFAELMDENLTPTQFAVLAKLREIGECSQNHLGRLVAMDAATVKGVVGRLANRGLLQSRTDDTDRRRLLVSLSHEGVETAHRVIADAARITARTLEPLDRRERETLLNLLERLT